MIGLRKNILSEGQSGVLTIGSELVSIDVPGAYAGNSTTGTGTVIYDKIVTQPGQVLRIMLMPATSNIYTTTMFVEWDGRTTNNVNKTISFSFKNPFIYEGQFCDPPYKESLDCSPSNPFFLNSFYKNYYSYYARQYITTSGWKRMFLLPDFFHGTRLAFYGKIMILKEYIHNLQELYIVDFSIYDVPTQSVTKGYSIEPLFYGSRDTAGEYITKFRFAKDPNTSRIYLEYYYKNTNSNAIRIYIKDFIYETTTLADLLGSYPDADVLNTVFKKGLISDQTTVTNDVLIGSEVNTIVKTTYFNEPS